MSLEPERVLKLRGKPAFLRAVAESPLRVLNPALVEHDEEIIARLDNPARAALPAQVAAGVIELDIVKSPVRPLPDRTGSSLRAVAERCFS